MGEGYDPLAVCDKLRKEELCFAKYAEIFPKIASVKKKLMKKEKKYLMIYRKPIMMGMVFNPPGRAQAEAIT